MKIVKTNSKRSYFETLLSILNAIVSTNLSTRNYDNNANNAPDKQMYTKHYEVFFPMVRTEVVPKYNTPVIFLIKIMVIIM